jgi:hypothetical protein
MNLEAGRDVALKMVEEREKFLVAMARLAWATTEPSSRLSAANQGGGSMLIVVVGYPAT